MAVRAIFGLIGIAPSRRRPQCRKRALVNLVVDEKADRARAGQLQDHRVDIGDVVGQQQHAAGGRQRLQPTGVTR